MQRAKIRRGETEEQRLGRLAAIEKQINLAAPRVAAVCPTPQWTEACLSEMRVGAVRITAQPERELARVGFFPPAAHDPACQMGACQHEACTSSSGLHRHYPAANMHGDVCEDCWQGIWETHLRWFAAWEGREEHREPLGRSAQAIKRMFDTGARLVEMELEPEDEESLQREIAEAMP